MNICYHKAMSFCFPWWSSWLQRPAPPRSPQWLPPALLSDHLVHCAQILLDQPTDADTMKHLSLLMVSMNIVEFRYQGHVFSLAPVVEVKSEV